MENIRRRFNSPTKSLVGGGGGGQPAQGSTNTTTDGDAAATDASIEGGKGEVAAKSVFHTPLVTWSPDSVKEAGDRVANHLTSVDTFCRTSTSAIGQLACMLKGSQYAVVADQCCQRLDEVQHFTKAEVAQVATEVKATLSKVGPVIDEKGIPKAASEEDIRLVATAFTRLMQLHCQFLLTASEALSPLSKYVNDGVHSPSGTKPEDFSLSQSAESAAGQLTNNVPTPNSATSSDGHGNNNNNQCEQDSNNIKFSSSTADTTSTTGNNNINKSNNMVHAVGSPSGLRKISSFFSKLARTAGPVPGSEESQSSFYVTIPKDECSVNEGNKENVIGGGGPPPIGISLLTEGEANKSAAATSISKLKLPTGGADVFQAATGLPLNGRLATQEELDSVIDLLSGGQRSPMQAIPENVPPQHHQHLPAASKVAVTPQPPPPPPPPPIGHYHTPPPPLFTLPPPDGPPPPLDVCGLYRNHQHRRSDGLLTADATFPRDHKTNTWPYRPRAAGGGGGGCADMGPPMMHPMHGVGVYDGGGPADMDYTRYLASIKAMKGGPGTGAALGGSLGGSGPWSSGDTGLHRSWPLHLFNHDGGENTSRNWSTVGDSSSCSDESSTGDTPWSVGLDLVGAVSDKRRHSSGEESFPGAPPAGHPVETRPRSVENLLESKSTNTWPPKQPWAKFGAPGGGAGAGMGGGRGDNGPDMMPLHPAVHPPLTMQWSDPLTNRPLSAWDGAGTTPSFSNQRLQSFPSLTHSGNIDIMPPTGLVERQAQQQQQQPAHFQSAPRK